MVLGRSKLRQLGLVDRYLARSIAVPLIGSLILAAMLLVLDKMLRLFQYVVDAGGPVSVVWRMLANLLPEYLSLGIPIGLMLGILLAFRKLALSSELDAMRGIGIGYGRLLRVPFAYAIPLALINLGIVGYLQPFTEYRYEALRFDLNSGALGAAVKVGEFNRLGKRLTLRIESSENKGTQLHGIFVETDDGKGMTIAATADHGRFLSTDDPNTILFRLTKGRLVQDSTKFSTPRTLAFDSYDLPVNLPVIDQFRRRGGTESDELYLHELWRIGIFLGLLIVVAYHKVNQYGEQAGSNGELNPFLALWVPLVLFATMIGWMYHVLAHRPGGQPIGALEWFFARVAKRIRSLIPKFGEA
jgi:lipopolysaccharide export system permease protein